MDHGNFKKKGWEGGKDENDYSLFLTIWKLRHQDKWANKYTKKTIFPSWNLSYELLCHRTWLKWEV